MVLALLPTFPSGTNGYVSQLNLFHQTNQFTVHVGPNDREHTYDSGGTVDRNVVRPYDGQVVYFDELYIRLER